MDGHFHHIDRQTDRQVKGFCKIFTGGCGWRFMDVEEEEEEIYG